VAHGERVPAVAIYTRISRDPTGEQTATHRQEMACRDYASARGWEVVGVYEDVDVSAYSTRPRPNYESMLDAVHHGQLSGVLCWKLDRLVRLPSEFERCWRILESRNAILASVTEPLDSSTPYGLALVRLLVTFAHLESATRSVRLKAKEREMAIAGRPPKGRCYGHNRDWTVNEAEAAVLQEAAQRVLRGEALTRIAADLNARGVPPPRGSVWYGRSLHQLLVAPRLVGDRAYLGDVVARDAWPAVLDRVTAARVRAVFADPTRRGARLSTSRLLYGLLVCGACGHLMVGNRRDGHLVYQCPNRPTGCGSVSVRAGEIEAHVRAKAFRRVGSVRRQLIAEGRFPARSHPTDDISGGTVEALDDLARAMRELCRDYYVERRLERDSFLSAYNALVARRTRCAHESTPQWRTDVLKDLLAPGELARQWPLLAIDRQRAILAVLITAVTVAPRPHRLPRFDPTRIAIEWRHLGGPVQGGPLGRIPPSTDVPAVQAASTLAARTDDASGDVDRDARATCATPPAAPGDVTGAGATTPVGRAAAPTPTIDDREPFMTVAQLAARIHLPVCVLDQFVECGDLTAEGTGPGSRGHAARLESIHR
jgi:DNA invertase Pin-like site-specific DNA recombinase